MMIRLEFAKKPLLIPEGSEMAKKVCELEDIINTEMSIFDDEELFEKYRSVYNLPLDERRLLLVFSILDGSINKTALFFNVDRKTIKNRLETIIPKII